MIREFLTAALLTWPTALSAATDISGIIGHLDWTTRELALDNGNRYAVVRGINMGKFKTGDRVVIRVENDAGKQRITKIKLGETFPLPPTQPHVHRHG